jgi:hypothetical protein
VHKPSACEGRSHVFQAEKKRKPEEQKDSEQKLKLAKAYETIKEVLSGEDSNCHQKRWHHLYYMAKILFLKIGMATITYIMMYSIMATYQIFFYQAHKITVKDSEYIPKSKRNHLWKRINPMKTWLSEKWKIIEENVMASTMSKRHKKL